MLKVPAGLFMHLDEFHSELHAACPSAHGLSDLQRRTIFLLQSDSKAEFRSSRCAVWLEIRHPPMERSVTMPEPSTALVDVNALLNQTE